jgi:hypothetical protein
MRWRWSSEEERLFFSEEKNQKTFDSPPADVYRPWPDRLNLLRDKSLLLPPGGLPPFFRKEGLSLPSILPVWRVVIAASVG